MPIQQPVTARLCREHSVNLSVSAVDRPDQVEEVEEFPWQCGAISESKKWLVCVCILICRILKSELPWQLWLYIIHLFVVMDMWRNLLVTNQ